MTIVRSHARAVPPDLRIGVTHAADGWPLRRFDWPAATGRRPRGSLMFQGGRGDFIEKYLELAADWRTRGWRVSGFDWRGQGGSGRPDEPATLAGHVAAFDRLVADYAGVVAGWLGDTPGPHVLVGHSMGGHLLLRLLAEHRPAVDAVVMVAPMFGLASRPLPAWLARRIAAVVAGAGLARRPAWREGDRPGATRDLRARILTGDADRYADELWWREADPTLIVGPPSWGWIAAAYASIARAEAAGVPEAVTLPCLILAARHDRLVDGAAIARVAARLPAARLLVRDDAAHEMLREADPIRTPLLAAIDAFLDEAAPAP